MSETVLPGPVRVDGIILRGRLVISSGRLTLFGDPGQWTALVRQPSVVVHTAAEVEMLRTRLAPPWMNTHLVITDGSRVALATIPLGQRHRYEQALSRAGFRVVTRWSWFSMGGSRIR